MASKLVMDAVSARLMANWDHCPVIDPNTGGDTPSDGSAFLTVQYPVANEEHVGIGAVGQRTFRESGAIRFVLAVSRGAGLDPATQWIEDLRTLFRAAQFDGVDCEAASPAAIDDANDGGNYYLLRVVVPYWADIFA